MRVAGLLGVAVFVVAIGSAATMARDLVVPAVPLFAVPQALGAIPTTPHFAAVISLAAADFTGDGLDDVLVARANWPTPERYQVRMLVNDGRGNLVDETDKVFTGPIPEVVFPY